MTEDGRNKGADAALGILGSGTLSGCLHLDRAEALRYLGYAGQELDAELAARFEDIADCAERVLAPAYVYRTYAVDSERTRWKADEVTDAAPQVALADCGVLLQGSDIAAHLRGSRAVVLMAVTCGFACERELKRLESLSATDALLYSAATSALVEAAACAVEARVVEAAHGHGLFTSAYRFSPGYGDLPLTAQPALLEALDAQRRIGLAVTEGNLLVPIKSITAVTGVYAERSSGGAERRTCGQCALRMSCTLRERGVSCYG